jgi:DNA-binding transcriptional regulator YdaS (Cro superfamily)
VNTNKGLEKAIKHYKKAKYLAAVLGVGQTSVSAWKVKGVVPAKHCPKIAQLTGVSLHELRPDVYPASLTFKK